jgi:hypothetical protein
MIHPSVRPIVVHVSQGFSWIEILAPAFAAIAAGASWRSVFIARRNQVDADRPQLVFNLAPIEAGAHPTRKLTMLIENVGRGVAVFPGFVLLSGEGFGAKDVVRRTLPAGENVMFGIDFITTEGAVGIVFCEDRYNNVYVWGDRRQCRQYRKRKRRQLTPRKMIHDLFKIRPDLEQHPVDQSRGDRPLGRTAR